MNNTFEEALSPNYCHRTTVTEAPLPARRSSFSALLGDGAQLCMAKQTTAQYMYSMKTTLLQWYKKNWQTQCLNEGWLDIHTVARTPEQRSCSGVRAMVWISSHPSFRHCVCQCLTEHYSRSRDQSLSVVHSYMCSHVDIGHYLLHVPQVYMCAIPVGGSVRVSIWILRSSLFPSPASVNVPTEMRYSVPGVSWVKL